MARTATRTRRTAAKPTPAKRTTRQAPAPVEETDGGDYGHLLEKEPTAFHMAHTEWLKTEVGYNPAETKNRAEAFLMGVSLATSSKRDFQQSDWLVEWREENGYKKRGPASKADAEPEEETDVSEDEDAVEALEEELNALTLVKLRARAKKEGVDLSDVSGWKKADYVNAILDVLFPEDDSDEEDTDEEAEALAADLAAMTLPEVRKAAGKYGVKYARTDKKTDIIEAIVAAAFPEEESEEDEDEDLEDEDEFEDEEPEEDDVEEDDEEEEEPPARRPGRRTVAKQTATKTVTRGKAPAGKKKGKYLF